MTAERRENLGQNENLSEVLNRRAALVEKMVLSMCAEAYKHIPNLDKVEQAKDPYWTAQAVIALDIALEEAAKVAESYSNMLNVDDGGISCQQVANAIRALKSHE